MIRSARLVIVTCLTLIAIPILAGEAGRSATAPPKVLLDNERVRVIQIEAQPGEKSPKHSHPAHVIYALTDATTRFTSPDGKTEVKMVKAGDLSYRPAVMHEAENIGKSVNRHIIFELKDTALGAPLKRPGPDPVKVGGGLVTLRHENDRIRVLEARLKPGDKEPLHGHTDYVVHVVSGGKLTTTSADGKSEEAELATGATVARPGLAHSGENTGKTLIHALVLEFKHAVKKK